MARRFHDVQIGGAPFSIDVRYQNLKQIGGGSYGIVCSADDTVENRFVLPLVSLIALFWFLLSLFLDALEPACMISSAIVSCLQC
jgi:hypothetical protein